MERNKFIHSSINGFATGDIISPLIRIKTSGENDIHGQVEIEATVGENHAV
jgi:hypothetical protein